MHRKRSQLAVIDAKGKVLAKRNVPGGVEPILRDADLRQSGGVPVSAPELP